MKVRVVPQLLPPNLEWRWTRHFNVLGLSFTVSAVIARVAGHVPNAPIAYLASALMFFAVGYWLRSRHLAQQLTAALEETRRAEHLARMGMLTAAFAHEQKNAVMVLQGFAELAQKTGEQNGTSPQLRSQLETIIRQARSQLTQLRSFLTLVKGEKTDQGSVPIGEAVAEVTQLLRPLATSRELRFESDFDVNVDRRVEDPTFREALLNLGLNALEHAASRIRITASAEGATLVIAVENDDRAAAGLDTTRLFEPFASKRPGGIGLGLHQVHTAVEREGGTVTCEARAEGGVKFVIRLPAQPIVSAVPAAKTA